MALTLLQWNAQGLLNHGQELIKYLNSRKNSPIHLICIQETWFNDDRILQIPSYLCVTRNRRNQTRGGCALYIHDSINYESPTMDDELELQTIKIHYDNLKINLVNFYNPCKKTGSPHHGKNNRKSRNPEYYYPRGFQCPQLPMGK